MRRTLVFLAALATARTVHAQANTTAGTAANVQWGQTALSIENGGSSETWFLVRVVAGRSYCVDTGNTEHSLLSERSIDTKLFVYHPDGTTEITHNDDITTNEPQALHFSRACWIPTISENNYVKMTPFSPSPASYVSLRFVETTLFCPWFFVAGDYNAFSLIRNTSGSPLSGVLVIWRDLSGSVAGTTTVSVPGNGTIILNARDFVNPIAVSNGSIEIAHTGSVSQLQGSTTTLSGTTGLGFDAQFDQRKTW
jgi:hypothetical protein